MREHCQVPTPVKLDLAILEADQVATPFFGDVDARAVDGIVFDAFGNPVEYHTSGSHSTRTACVMNHTL